MKILKRIGIVLVLIVLVFAIIFMIPIGDPESPYMTEHFEKVELYLEHRDVRNTEVSQASVAWQLDHVLRSIISIHTALEESDPKDYDGGKFSIPKEVVFLLGDFPRGVAQAPDALNPPENVSTEEIMAHFKEAKERMGRIDQLDEHQFFDNPAFGKMARNEALRFIKIHTDHHYKIIEDILAE